MTVASELARGARNLLVNCAGVEPGDTILIVHENPDLGWYDLDAPMAVAAEAGKLGATVLMVEAGAPENQRDPGLADAIAAHDCVIFFARIGDQDRFADPAPGKTCVMCYARDAEMLASPYGTTPYQALEELKEAVNDILLGASRIEIRCPLGTEISGTVSDAARRARADVSVRRFPLGVPQPIEAATFSGRVALARYLTPTGSRVYEPPSLKIGWPVFATVESGRIESLDGDAGDVARIRQHYELVAELFGIDRDAVHSWHAGIHPGCAYRAGAAEDPDRWSNTVFTNPRFLHFHTCGSLPPGEICWMVLDHTVAVDGANLWQHGRLRPEAFAAGRACLEKWPELAAIFARPSDRIGLSE
jgi:hypothetical protein